MAKQKGFNAFEAISEDLRTQGKTVRVKKKLSEEEKLDIARRIHASVDYHGKLEFTPLEIESFNRQVLDEIEKEEKKLTGTSLIDSREVTLITRSKGQGRKPLSQDEWDEIRKLAEQASKLKSEDREVFFINSVPGKLRSSVKSASKKIGN